LDYTWVDELTLVKHLVVANHARAMIGIEVGLDKGEDDAVGKVSAPRSARGVPPADAAKVVRELRFGGLRHGYVLEFYRPDQVESALSVSQRLAAELRGLGEHFAPENFTLILTVAGEDEQSPVVSSWPDSWKQAWFSPGEYADIWSVQLEPAGGGCQRFLRSSGRCTRVLHAELHRLMAEHRLGQRTCCRRKNMSLARDYRIKVSNRNERPERIYEMHPDVQAALSSAGLPVRDGQLLIPNEVDQEWVGKVVAAIKGVMDGADLAVQGYDPGVRSLTGRTPDRDPGPLTYTVAVQFADQGTAEDWLRWLEGRLADMLARGATAEVVELDDPPRSFEVRYRFPSREAFDHYERDQAPGLLAEELRLFPAEKGVSYRRTVGGVRAAFPRA
jgi:hypothetical protein